MAAIAVVATSSGSGAEPDPALSTFPGPAATASGGGGGTVVYPAIVNVRLERAEAALERTTAMVDQGKGATRDLNTAKANMVAQ